MKWKFLGVLTFLVPVGHPYDVPRRDRRLDQKCAVVYLTGQAAGIIA
ncbi:MAG: hypothetical protein ACLVCS_08115 [Christensenellaceae bacterium]